MKILVVHCAYRFKGGEDKVVEEELALLKQAGHEVALLEFSNDGNVFWKILQLPFNITSYRAVKKAIRNFSPDVVHVHNLHFAASPSVLYAAKHSKVPVVYTLHNYRLICPSAILFHNQKVFLHSISASFPWKAVQEGVYKNSRLLTFWLALSMKLHHWLGTWRLPSRYIVLSNHAKKILLQSRLGIPEEQFVVKPNFCFDFADEATKRDDNFLFVGRLSIEKGVRILLNLFSRLPYQITIAGDGPMREEVVAYTKHYQNISYAGSLKKEELAVLMQRSSALVFPSIWYEGMPLTIIEAFANGLPVIATKLGAMEYMVTNNQDGLLFEVGNEKALEAALAHWSALTQSEKDVYRLQARKTYERNYIPEINAAQLLTVYNSVQPEKPQPSLAFS